jgi:hypothetical protein
MITGLDISPEFIRIARGHAESDGMNETIQWVPGRAALETLCRVFFASIVYFIVIGAR